MGFGFPGRSAGLWCFGLAAVIEQVLGLVVTADSTVATFEFLNPA